MSVQNEELVSVIIPAYNMAQLTVKTVESVLNQSYKNIEIIVVDDGSTDDTKEKLSIFGNKINCICKENGGACSARNVGIRISKGKYIGILDCDDLYDAKKIELSVKFLEENPDFGLVHTDAYFVDQNDTIIRRRAHKKCKYSGWIKDKLILSTFICNSTVVLRRECFDQVGLFDEDMFPPADWDMWLRVSEFFQVGYVNAPLTKYRVTSSGCLNNLEQTRKEYLLVLDKFFLRNKLSGSSIKKKAYAACHLSFAQWYVVKNNKMRAREEVLLSLKEKFFNGKAIFFLLCNLFFYGYLEKKLKSKILFI